MKATESQEAPAEATESQPGAPAGRLVIRVKLVPAEPPPPPDAPRLSRGALLLILGAIAVLLSWAGISMFGGDPAPAPGKATPVLGDEPPPVPATEPPAAKSAKIEPRPTEPKPTEPAARQQPDAPPSPINEVIPDVPKSARDTIRGTIRVSVRVTLDKAGTVLAATADEPGPSRYFERLALEAAKKWTFTPANSPEQRIMLLKFNFTRTGTTARTN